MSYVIDGPDTWCYDALELPRVFAVGLHATTITHSLEVLVTEFDMNPAAHTTYLRSRVPIETYLATAAADDEVARYLLDHRTAGPTTLVTIESVRRILWWTIDGLSPNGIPDAVPGDVHAGLVDESRAPALFRAVLVPGSRLVHVAREEMVPYECTIEIRRGEQAIISIG